jgi:hypothetical protein
MKSNLLAYRYSTKMANRIFRGDNDLDMYSNFYKYRSNKTKKGKKPFSRKKVARLRKYKFRLPGRFEKTTLYQQFLKEFADLSLHSLNLFLRLREPVRRLLFFRESKILS